MFRDRLARLLHQAGYEVDVLADGLRARNHADPAKSNGPSLTVRVVVFDDEPTVERVLAAYGDDEYTLVVVSGEHLPKEWFVLSASERPDWVRLIHALHFGRVYTYLGDELHCVHLDYDQRTQTYDVQWYGSLDDDLLATLRAADNTPWLSEYEDRVFKVGGFGDGAWWKGWMPDSERVKEQTRQSTEEFLREAIRRKTAERQERQQREERQQARQSEKQEQAEARQRESSNRAWPNGFASFNDFLESLRREQERASKQRASQQTQERTPPPDFERLWQLYLAGLISRDEFKRRAFGDERDPAAASGGRTWSSSTAGYTYTGFGWDYARHQEATAPARHSALAAHYEALNLPDGAPLADVKTAYRRLARQHHPDTGGSDEAMTRINLAYQALERALA